MERLKNILLVILVLAVAYLLYAYILITGDNQEYCGVFVIGIKWSDKAIARNIRLWNE
jgi:hypothetical protein